MSVSFTLVRAFSVLSSHARMCFVLTTLAAVRVAWDVLLRFIGRLFFFEGFV